MKLTLLFGVLVLLTGSVAVAQEHPQEAAPTRIARERTFFPRNAVRGYVDFSLAPSHNEPDLGRCSGPGGNPNGANSQCAAFARYMWSGYLELQPFGRGVLRRAFVFVQPKLFLGENVPQFKYTMSAAGIAVERTVGLGVELPRSFELRVVQHQLDWLGRYSNGSGLGPGDLHGQGAYGTYATVGVRWYFGSFNRAHAPQ